MTNFVIQGKVNISLESGDLACNFFFNFIPEDGDFKIVYKKFGSKIQKNVHLTESLLMAIDEQGWESTW